MYIFIIEIFYIIYQRFNSYQFVCQETYIFVWLIKISIAGDNNHNHNEYIRCIFLIF
jgi:hypothetical protein